MIRRREDSIRPASLSGRFLCQVLLVSGLSAIAVAKPPHTFELPDHGVLTIVMPEGWAAKVRQPPNRLPPTINLRPAAEAGGEMIVTPIWPIGSMAKAPDDAKLRSEVGQAANGAASQSVEGTLPIQEIKGVDGRGFYFSATDRAPNPGEYKYLTQGIIRVGDIALGFTVLTNDRQEPVLRAALEMLRTATHRPSTTL